jgi:hypothetical protein
MAWSWCSNSEALLGAYAGALRGDGSLGCLPARQFIHGPIAQALAGFVQFRAELRVAQIAL